MTSTRPDLANLRMQSIEDFLPTSSLSTTTKTSPPVSKTVTPPSEKNKKALGLLRSSFASSSKTPASRRISTDAPERNNNPYGTSLDHARSSLSPSPTSPTPSTPQISTPPPEKSNNPYVSNNPWVSTSLTPNQQVPTLRPDLTRYKSYSLDLPRPQPSPSSPVSAVTAETTPNRNSISLMRTDEDSVAAALGLGHLNDLHEFTDYNIWNASLTNMRVCPADDNGPFFYVAHRSFLPNRPGVVIHSGSTKEGAVMAVAHLDYFSTSNSLGIGDPDGAPAAVMWEKMHKESFWTHMRYSFSWDVEATVKGLTETERRVFEWHRTKNNFLWDDQGDLVLVEKGRDEVLALYEGKGPLGQLPGKRRGTLKIKPKAEGFKEGWEMMVLLAWASIVELSRRRARSRRVSSIFGHI